MSKPRANAPAPAGIDPRSDATVLAYAGGPVPRDVPTRDLSANDLGRIAHTRAIAAAFEVRPVLVPPGETLAPPEWPARPDHAALAALADELVAGGSFVRVPADPPEKPEA